MFFVVDDYSQEDVAPIAALEPPLKGFQILLIICAILFLSLLLLGLGCSYYCLRKRPLTIIRHPLPSVTGSEITKLSGSSLGSRTNTTNHRIRSNNCIQIIICLLTC